MTNVASKYFEEEILSATPLQLVSFLYQGAVAELRNARKHLAAGQVPERCAAISKACDIIAELTSSLDCEAGGDTAQRLAELYHYCTGRLLDANLRKEDGPIVEVLGLLTTLSEAWAQLAANQSIPDVKLPSSSVYGSQATEFVSQSWSF